MFSHRENFKNYVPAINYRTIHLNDDSEIPILRHGEIMLNFRVGSEIKPSLLKRVLHVPGLKSGLYLITFSHSKGNKVIFCEPKTGMVKIVDTQNKCIAKRNLNGNLWLLTINNGSNEKMPTFESAYITFEEWHARMGHPNFLTKPLPEVSFQRHRDGMKKKIT